MTTPDVRIRLATEADTDEIVDVCAAALGWTDPDFDRALFRWKHVTNAFGRSLIMVAEDEDGMVAVRPFMRWRFRNGGGAIPAARAVDTATLRHARGRGLFRTLTLAGLDELADRGVEFVFNTPNDQSRPGYFKMGWVDAGQIGFGFGVAALRSLPTILRSRTAATKPSIPTPALGIDVVDGLAGLDEEAAEGRTRAIDRAVLSTDHTIESLTWRFADGPIDYRWLSTGDGVGCIVRLRQRGRARELVVAHVVGDPDASRSVDAVRQAMQDVEADYCLTPSGFGSTRTIRRIGPTLTLREVARNPTAEQFDWAPGDIELF